MNNRQWRTFRNDYTLILGMVTVGGCAAAWKLAVRWSTMRRHSLLILGSLHEVYVSSLATSGSTKSLRRASIMMRTSRSYTGCSWQSLTGTAVPLSLQHSSFRLKHSSSAEAASSAAGFSGKNPPRKTRMPARWIKQHNIMLTIVDKCMSII